MAPMVARQLGSAVQVGVGADSASAVTVEQRWEFGPMASELQNWSGLGVTSTGAVHLPADYFPGLPEIQLRSGVEAHFPDVSPSEPSIEPVICDDGLNAARGMLLGLLLSVPLWATLIAVAVFLI